MSRIAFLGLGAIGRPMAAHLARDPHELTVWNRTRERAAAFGQEHNVAVASTPAEAVRGAEFVITCLPTSQDVRGLLGGADGVLAGIADGALMIDCTSGDPGTSRAIEELLQPAGVSFIDAPVSGGTSGAEKGTLTIMCGGRAEDVERARGVLELMGKRVVHCGAVGAGDAVKAVNNALLAVHILSAAEGLLALSAMGVSPALALEVINSSSGRSNASENLIPQRVVSRAFPRTFRAALLDKDVRIAAGIAREQHVPSPLLQLASDVYSAARREVGEEADHVEAVKLLERWAGTEIK